MFPPKFKTEDTVISVGQFEFLALLISARTAEKERKFSRWILCIKETYESKKVKQSFISNSCCILKMT